MDPKRPKTIISIENATGSGRAIKLTSRGSAPSRDLQPGETAQITLSGSARLCLSDADDHPDEDDVPAIRL